MDEEQFKAKLNEIKAALDAAAARLDELTRASGATLSEQIATLQVQQSYQTNALRAALEARWSGEADSVDGWVKALNPTLQTDPKTPLYP